MKQNSSRERLLQELDLSSEPWVCDPLWSDELNQKLIAWIAAHFIPERRYRVLVLCRTQAMTVWKLFLNWLGRNGRSLDLRAIDPNLLIDFERELPSLRWSRSAIRLVEGVLLEVRRCLHSNKILRFSGFSGEYSEFFIGVEDYRAIRNHFLEEGNDYEIVYFELASLVSGYRRSLCALGGGDVYFESDRAFLKPGRDIPFSRGPYACPTETSRELLRLLRSRDILAKEKIFDGAGDIRRSFEKRTDAFCERVNIPLFAKQAIWGFVGKCAEIQEQEERENRPGIKPRNFIGRQKPLSKENVLLLDQVHEQVIGSAAYFEAPYQPIHLLFWA